jgi:hypothetical protein
MTVTAPSVCSSQEYFLLALSWSADEQNSRDDPFAIIALGLAFDPCVNNAVVMRMHGLTGAGDSYQ